MVRSKIPYVLRIEWNRYMELNYATEVTLFFSVILENVDACIQFWHEAEDFVAVEIVLYIRNYLWKAIYITPLFWEMPIWDKNVDILGDPGEK
jgi:hypothetical protein